MGRNDHPPLCVPGHQATARASPPACKRSPRPLRVSARLPPSRCREGRPQSAPLRLLNLAHLFGAPARVPGEPLCHFKILFLQNPVNTPLGMALAGETWEIGPNYNVFHLTPRFPSNPRMEPPPQPWRPPAAAAAAQPQSRPRAKEIFALSVLNFFPVKTRSLEADLAVCTGIAECEKPRGPPEGCLSPDT